MWDQRTAGSMTTLSIILLPGVAYAPRPGKQCKGQRMANGTPRQRRRSDNRAVRRPQEPASCVSARWFPPTFIPVATFFLRTSQVDCTAPSSTLQPSFFSSLRSLQSLTQRKSKASHAHDSSRRRHERKALCQLPERYGSLCTSCTPVTFRPLSHQPA